MSARLHVVGAGVAGLAAAVYAARAGWRVALHEMAPNAGGRCRAVRHADGRTGDNGTHTLVGANRRALAFLDAIGARSHWVEPEPTGLPVADLERGTAMRLGPPPWSWLRPDRRPPGIRLGELLRVMRLGIPGPDRPVASITGQGALARAVIEPLTVAALNTPFEEASSRRLATVLRRLARPGAARVLVAERGLGPDLVEPALAALRREGAEIAYNRRLQSVTTDDGGSAARLIFGDGAIELLPDDAVVLALPPFALQPLFPDLPLPDAFEPIVNLHYATDHAGPLRFVGLLGAQAQWLLFRPGTVSVTISAARDAVYVPPDELANAIWPEVRAAAGLAGIATLADAVPPCRVIKEKRATVRQAVGDHWDVPLQPLANVTLAGDWLSMLPATIEAAVASGHDAVRRLDRSRGEGPDTLGIGAAAAAS